MTHYYILLRRYYTQPTGFYASEYPLICHLMIFSNFTLLKWLNKQKYSKENNLVV